MSRRRIRFWPFLLCLWIAGTPALGIGADPSHTDSQEQTETTILHVDKYAVYGPNLIFYWDTGMTKQRISVLSATAERLRNKAARVTYRVTEDARKRPRFLLVDIAPAPRDSTPPPHDRPTDVPAMEKDQEPFTGELEQEPDSLSFAQGEGPGYPEAEAEGVPDSDRIEDEESSQVGFLPVSISKKEVLHFIEGCMEANNRKNLPAALACYADKVDYYDKGRVDRDFIRKDKGYYFRQWDTVSSSIEGDVVVIVTDETGLRLAKFISSFEVTKGQKTVRGKAENIWKIMKIGDQLKIIDEKQRILPPG